MRPAGAGAALIAVLALASTAALAASAAPNAAPNAAARADATTASASVRLDRTSESTRVGQRFGFRSTVRNDTDQPLPGLIAHLNVLSRDAGVYVDPEDWSSQRTAYLQPMPAHSSARLDWTVQAVNDGHFVVYVAVTTGQSGGGVTASDPLLVTVARQRTLNPAGAIPVVLAMPLAVLLLIGYGSRARRRLR